MPMKALDLAIERAKGVTKLAVSIGVGQSVVSNWKSRGTEPDPISCVRIERKWGVPRQELRPNDWRDIWPELVPHGQQALPNV
jgi:DNA-binding transcriptional regulator YdaS (Cro superfamily)